MGVNQELKVLYNLKKNWRGVRVRLVRTKNGTYCAIYNEKGGSHICQYCTTELPAITKLRKPWPAKGIPCVCQTHTVNYALGCLRRGHSRCLEPLTTGIEFLRQGPTVCMLSSICGPKRSTHWYV